MPWRIRQSASNRTLGGHEVAGSIRRDHDAIDRLVVELHGTILQLRMVPVAQVFRSFPRLVRDMSRQLGKNVRLVTRGETAEADKTIVDRLFEPLVHLVRNALDHGIESPEQRRAAGKPETATITIEASRTGDRFMIEVIDDGRGIDPAMVRRRASETRIDAGRRTGCADRRAGHRSDLLRPAFRPLPKSRIFPAAASEWTWCARRSSRSAAGFRCHSRVGAGTTVRLDLPMNIAMSRIMVVEAGGQVFGISMDAVTETVRLTPDRISRIKNNDGFVLRDRIVPICSLAELMKLPATRPKEAGVRGSSSSPKLPAGSPRRGRRHPGSPRGRAQADAGAAVQRPRLCRHDPAGRWTRCCWCWI